MSSEAFIPAFYCSFLQTSEEVRQKFALTKFEVQEKRLAQSLRTLAGVMKGDRLALAHLNARAESHDRRHLNIKPELYVLWKATLLATASQFDRDWTPYVRESWESILDSAIQFMTKRYEVD